MEYDSIVIGGGIAGLQAAIQLGRYEHDVLVIDAGYGRSTLCRGYHNLLGWPNGISGTELRMLGRQHAESAGVQFIQEEVVMAKKIDELFVIQTKQNKEYKGKTILLATGLLDRFPDLPELVPCLGVTIYVCPDCDGYEARDKPTVILGSGESGARMALMLLYWTDQVTYINHDGKKIGESLLQELKEQKITYIVESIQRIEVSHEGHIQGVRLQNGSLIEAERGFIAFGGNQVKSDLAVGLGVERMENKHIQTDPRTKMTNVEGVWVAGDLGVHAEQAAIAMGEGSLAAIWMHKKLMSVDQPQPVLLA